MGTLISRTITIAIERSHKEIYEFVHNPENFPKWVTSFCLSARKSGDDWIMETTEGPMSVRFQERNNYGVLDHYVRFASGEEIMNPVRVIPNGSGSEVIFTIYQTPDMSGERFNTDSGMVEKDLNTLKSILEK